MAAMGSTGSFARMTAFRWQNGFGKVRKGFVQAFIVDVANGRNGVSRTSSRDAVCFHRILTYERNYVILRSAPFRLRRTGGGRMVGCGRAAYGAGERPASPSATVKNAISGFKCFKCFTWAPMRRAERH